MLRWAATCAMTASANNGDHLKPAPPNQNPPESIRRAPNLSLTVKPRVNHPDSVSQAEFTPQGVHFVVGCKARTPVSESLADATHLGDLFRCEAVAGSVLLVDRREHGVGRHVLLVLRKLTGDCDRFFKQLRCHVRMIARRSMAT